ncbi:MAG: M20 family metallo-hydrolase [Planctomycetota bacterium]
MQQTEMKQLLRKIDSYRNAMIELQSELTAIPAISPKSGGEGEVKKAAFLKKYLQKNGFHNIKEYKAPDKSAPCGYRPSLVAIIEGTNKSNKIWVMSHLDIVPPGARKLWKTDPYKLAVKKGKIFGRGVEDNQQAIVSSLFATKALIDLKIKPKNTIALLFVADEEMGSQFGLSYLVKKRLFNKKDIIIVPDGGKPDGSMIEVAEKSMMWFKFTTYGKQAHASRPDTGNNAHRVAANLLVKLDQLLHKKFNRKNKLFCPPESTFEPTKKEANVENVNTIPGEDVFFFDCRVLPQYNIKEVFNLVKQTVKAVEKEFGVKISINTHQLQQATPQTPENAEVVTVLANAINKVYKVKATPQGIGGGTVAAILRRAGYHAAVWARMDETAHQPNEYCKISNMLGDAKVFATIFCNA